MALQFRKASRKKVKIKMQIGGVSGSGKTTASLKLAYGLCGDWNKIAVIDSENGSSELYVGKDGIGEFNVVPLDSFSERDFINAINLCEKEGMEVVIIDTSTRLWDYLIELQTKLGGRYQDWKEPKERYKKYLYTMLQSNMHIISTVRKKEEYIIEQEDGKKASLKKIGLKDQAEGNTSYEMTLVFELDRDSHLAITSKDRTRLFEKEAPFFVTEETGRKIKEWCEEGTEQEIQVKGDISEALVEIDSAKDVEFLKELIVKYEHLKTTQDFISKIRDKQIELTPKKEK